MSSKSSSSKSRAHRPPKQHFDSSSSASSSSSSYSASDPDLSSSMGGYAYRHSMDSAQRPIASVELLRCMRCARTVEVTSTDDVSVTGMIRVGHNIYYCGRCAKLVGYK